MRSKYTNEHGKYHRVISKFINYFYPVNCQMFFCSSCSSSAVPFRPTNTDIAPRPDLIFLFMNLERSKEQEIVLSLKIFTELTL